MNLVRKFPVATAIGAVTVLQGAEQLAEQEHLLSGAGAGWVRIGLLVVGGLLALYGHNSSTSLADPRAADGTPLVPATPPGR